MSTLTLGGKRMFTKAKAKAYDHLKWEVRQSSIVNPMTNEVVFEQNDLEFPVGWSQNAVNIVAQKYFSGNLGAEDRERSMKQLIDRVVDTIVRQGYENGYFDSETDREDYREELKYVLATQRAAFNSPVWFNIGLADRTQQASACFILGIEDTMPAILNWYVEEGMIFKGGSGSGINLSAIRSSYEPLGNSAGTASGPLSFMRGADASAGAIKSGGKTRRAAKMVILNVDHPDIFEFIWSKAIEERKARDLQNLGWDMSLDGKDSFSVQYQNANISVRVTDDFMKAVINDDTWELRAVKDGRVLKTVKAKELFRQFAEASWECADPGMQFDTTINKWHTTPKAGRINGSNPCSEYMHLDNSACNLASINLLKFLNEADNSFNIEEFKHVTELMFTAQEILVGYSAYPTEKITKNARAYRELGIGYANLGALLMAQGLPYDSPEGRAQAAAITALLTGYSYVVSAKMAAKVGPFAGYNKDREAMLRVLRQHRQAIAGINANYVSEDLLSSATNVWDEAIDLAEKYGVRNSQASLLAPTGTIGLMMDCDTTGIEPDLGLVKVKRLVGGGVMSIVNQTVPQALRSLGYSKDKIDKIINYIDSEKTIIGAPDLDPKHLPVFACSMGDNSIHYMGHVKMMSAVQPFLSGAISKTVNMPESATVEDIMELHIKAWELGLKAIAIYRDNCKVAQPLSMAKKASTSQTESSNQTEPVANSSHQPQIIIKSPARLKLPKVRTSKTYKFQIADLEGYFTVSEYENHQPGEIFINVSKQGSTLSGLMDSFAIAFSLGLQYGVPLKNYIRILRGTSFAPYGLTDDDQIKTASSITDYIMRRLAYDYLSQDDLIELGLVTIESSYIDKNQAELISLKTDQEQNNQLNEPTLLEELKDEDNQQDNVNHQPTDSQLSKNSSAVVDSTAPFCYNCGNITQKSGSCYVCTACGSTTGCS